MGDGTGDVIVEPTGLQRKYDEAMFKLLTIDVPKLTLDVSTLEKNVMGRLDMQDVKISAIPNEVYVLLNSKNGNGAKPEEKESDQDKAQREAERKLLGVIGGAFYVFWKKIPFIGQILIGYWALQKIADWTDKISTIAFPWLNFFK